MKTTIVILAVAALCGCASPTKFQLSKGESIVFRSSERAAQFRATFLQDPTHIGNIVPLDDTFTLSK